MMSDTHEQIPGLTQEEERELLRVQRQRNVRMAIALGVAALLLALLTMFMIYKTGFVPMDNADLFRST